MSDLQFERLSLPELQQLLAAIRRVRVGVFGDFALDVYWFVDPREKELSLETGLPTQPVAEAAIAPGGASNVVNNLVALGCGRVEVFGVIGDDVWGREMLRIFAALAVYTDGLLCAPRDWATPTFVKPHFHDEEGSRFDFGNYNRLADETADRLLASLASRLPDLDMVIVNEQVKQGIHRSDRLRRGLAALIREHPDRKFIVDSRHYSDAYPGAYLKINDQEATRLVGVEYADNALVLKEHALEAARALCARQSRPAFVTRGARGLVVAEERGTYEIPGIQILGRIDPVGAGDTLLAGAAAALAAGASPVTAAVLGNLAASITVQKIRQTGTASPAELLVACVDSDYVYRPELAEDARQARPVGATEFERITDREPPARVRYAVFDHDGTLSTLREGWERIMEPMMIRAILGPRYDTADESLYHRVVDRVCDYIDQSTGMQTLSQMQGLVKMVREFGCVPADEILDEFGYKRIYNDALLRMVRQRIAKLERGELATDDFLIKNAARLLAALRRAGVKLYLASGTDEEDVKAEARAMGYAELFEGRIYGAVGDVTKEAKRLVLDRLLNEIGGADGLVTFGDGPVEIRETHKRGGYTIGLASDELRRFGLNPAKRSRLIRAGADLIIPDFSQLGDLLAWLHIDS